MSPNRVVLIDPDPAVKVLARRLRAQEYEVSVFDSGEEGTRSALENPPAVVIADLWMEGVSGLQIARLLGAEPATEDVPVVLRSPVDEPRTRFWARHAGAAGYVAKGRFGELVRTLKRVVRPRDDGFFFSLGDGANLQNRIAQHLDKALFESVVASEIRALGTVGSFERLVDSFSQLLVQITAYRWMAVSHGRRVGVHARAGQRDELPEELIEHFDGPFVDIVWMEDDDADDGPSGRGVITAPICFGELEMGTLAVAPSERSDCDQWLVDLAARELGGALRIVALMEETQRLAVTDTLTGLLRRPPFAERLREGIAAGMWVMLLDLDRFKQINDRFGHGTGDRVLQATGRLLLTIARQHDGVACRWGGEEFVVALPQRDRAAALAVAEQIRHELTELVIVHEGTPVPVSASIGVASGDGANGADELIDHADLAMYKAKTSGRNQVQEFADLGADAAGAEEAVAPVSA